MREITDQDWDDFLSQYPDAHLLQNTSWSKLKSAFGWETSRVVSSNACAQILYKKLPFGFRWAYIPKGPTGDRWEELWPLVDDKCRRRKTAFLKVEPDLWEGEDRTNLNSLQSPKFFWSHHYIQPRRTLVVNLEGSEEEVLSRMKQKTRYNIRLAGRKGIVVKTSSDIQRFYNLMKLTGERDAFGIHRQAYYQKAYDLFVPDGQSELFFAEYAGELLAALMVFAYGGRAFYFYGASSNRFRNLMAPYAVQWEAIRWARNRGCHEYDLWGVPDEDLETLETEFIHRADGLWGVYRFKRGFGGHLKRTIGTWDRIYHPILYLIYKIWLKKN